jgi:hypothetical protein
MSGRQRREELRLLAALDRAVAPQRRPGVVTVAWRWRYELALAALLATVAAVLIQAVGVQFGLMCLSAMMGALGPPWPEWFTAWVWRIITPHRVRTGLAQTWIQNRSGRAPVILRVTSEPFGERVLLWCPAGTSAEDLHHSRAALRAACWAADVRIIRDERHSQRVTLEVIRHRGS